jgi:hypothetical protein
MTDRLPWPLEGLGLFTGNSHNILIVGPEGSGKTSNACTILAHLISMDVEEKNRLKKLTVISPALAASSIKTDFHWLTHVALPDLVLVLPTCRFLLLAGYENLTAPNAIMQS